MYHIRFVIKLAFLLHLLRLGGINAQTSISLSQAVDSLALYCPAAKLRQLDYESQLLQRRNYNLGFLPSLAFTLSPINFNHSLRLLQVPDDGSYRYIEDYSNNTSIGLTLKQKIRFTGGELSLSSTLGILSELSLKRTSFSSTPFSIGYSQQLWGARHLYQLERRIENLRTQVIKKQYQVDLFKIQLEVVRIYMEAIQNYLELEQSRLLHSRNDSLQAIAALKLKQGQITQYDYNQIELQTLGQYQAIEVAHPAYERTLTRLKAYLGIDNVKSIVLPKMNFPIFLDLAQVQADIDLNNPFATEQEIELILSDQAFYQVKLGTYLNGNINLSYGINQHAYRFSDAYRSGNVRQAVILGLQVPIFQWGINKNKLRIARNTYEANRIKAAIRVKELENEVSTLVDRYNHATKRWYTAHRSYTLAQCQYEILIEKFRLGKISLYELIMGERELQNALKTYYSAMQETVISYYTLRVLTLLDY